MAKPEWGIKRICQSCGTLYYDLRKTPIVCPKCGAEFDPEAVLKSRRARPIAVEEPKPRRPKAGDGEDAEEEAGEDEDGEEDSDAEDEEEKDEEGADDGPPVLTGDGDEDDDGKAAIPRIDADGGALDGAGDDEESLPEDGIGEEEDDADEDAR